MTNKYLTKIAGMASQFIRVGEAAKRGLEEPHRIWMPDIYSQLPKSTMNFTQKRNLISGAKHDINSSLSKTPDAITDLAHRTRLHHKSMREGISANKAKSYVDRAAAIGNQTGMAEQSILERLDITRPNSSWPWSGDTHATAASKGGKV